MLAWDAAIGTEILIILLLVLVNGVLAGAELALVSARRTRLRELADAGSVSARAALALRGNPERLLATVQIGITVVSATASAFGGASMARRLEAPLRALGLGDSAPGVALALVVGLVSYLSLILGELVPKSLGLRYSEPYTLLVARPLRGLAAVMRPLVWFLTASSNLVLRVFGDRTNFTESRLSAEELQQLVEEAARGGQVDAHAGEIASRAFDLGSLRLSAVMVPRSEVVALPRHAPQEEIRRVLLEEGHSRMPVYEDTLDNVVGYVVAKDLVGVAFEGRLVLLEDALRPALFLPASLRALEALKALQARRTQMAVVVDELGAMAGIVTVEDLLEELVGEILSEGDRPEELVRREADGALVQGHAAIRDVNRALDLELPEGEDYTTLAGLVVARTGTIPAAGTRLVLEDGTRLEVVESSARRVGLVRIVLPPQPQDAPHAGPS